MPWIITMENAGGELERRTAKTAEQAHARLIDIVESLGSVHDGDVFRIRETEEDSTPA